MLKLIHSLGHPGLCQIKDKDGGNTMPVVSIICIFAATKENSFTPQNFETFLTELVSRYQDWFSPAGTRTVTCSQPCCLASSELSSTLQHSGSTPPSSSRSLKVQQCREIYTSPEGLGRQCIGTH